jgi:acetylornithine deacetylase/succinyl-diaminopimelate desuccinylase-like protein
VLPGVDLIGEGSLTSRMWTRPALAVLGVDAPPVQGAVNAVVPVARAKVSMRLAPGDDPDRAAAALAAHLEGNAPWGARVTVGSWEKGAPFALDTTGPAYDTWRAAMGAAWGRDVVEVGVGGSIPFVAAFAETNPDAAIVLVGLCDDRSREHGPDESVDLGDLRRAGLAEAIALRALAG